MQADWLFLLTDVDCLYTANPNVDPHAEPIHEVFDMRDLQASRQPGWHIRSLPVIASCTGPAGLMHLCFSGWRAF